MYHPLAAGGRLTSGKASAYGTARHATGTIGNGLTGATDGVNAVAGIVAGGGDENEQSRLGAFNFRS